MNNGNSVKHGPIAWMAGNSVAANLVMLFLLVGGLLWGLQIKQEVFPEFTLDQVIISVIYPGASPEEVAEGIVLPIEEAIQSVDGIEEISSVASEGSGRVTIEAVTGTNLQQMATDIKNEIDRITSFPDEAEEPLVTIPSRKNQVITLVLYGNQPRSVLRDVTETIRDQLLQDKGITQVELQGHRPLEMAIEVSQDNLRRYNLKLSDIAAKIKNASIDLPGGSIKTRGGEILVRMTERRDFQEEFSSIPVVTGADGTSVTLGEIATIKDSFEETDQFLVYNTMPALGINVFRVGDQTPISISDAVQKHVETLRQTLPDGIHVATVNDDSQAFRQRMALLLKNGYFGLGLVFILLGIFLEARLAFWVTMGIPISFLGALLLIPQVGVSINMVSLFAFIISLGIVVDDAIVIGENVYSFKQRGYGSMEAAVMGAREVAGPVTFSILTNIVTFMPLYFVPGTLGKIFCNIPVVVVSVFLISLFESIFVLPAHLSHQKELKNPIMIFITRQQQKVSHGLTSLIKNVYGPFLRFSLRYRYISVTIGLVTLLIAVAYVKSGRMGIIMFPKVESDFSYATAELPVGVAVEDTMAVHDRLLASANQLINKIGREQQVEGILSFVNSNSTWVKVFMIPPEERSVQTADFTDRWRKATGNIAGIETMKFQSDFGGPGSGAGLTVELQHRNTDVLEKASGELAAALGFFPNVSDIDDGFTPGKDQIDFTLKPVGYQLGLNPLDVARQLRNSYYGTEVIRQLRGRNEIRIMVRNPEEERKSEYFLEEMLLTTPKGIKVPLRDVVELKRGKAFTAITRRDGRRVVSVTADVTPRNQADLVLNSITTDTLPQLMQKYPGLAYGFEGKQADRKESMVALGRGMMISMLLVYVLLAIPFRSYFQPAIIMVSIPFGIVGAIIGHLIMGYDLSILSMFGIVALSGVVVNDALVLIDCANRRVLEGYSHFSAIIYAGIQRFRPIMLTTLTTFFGLSPMILETSRQAKFLIPMAISLGFGILFSTVIVLVLVPALFIILEDIKIAIRHIFGLQTTPPIKTIAAEDNALG
ncbi:MAG: efflux RND transporter permease subunit [Proteobacteria bacterium]|nr:efflux RND transporter permease subunit [Desulfobulbaceae bacterium]MBU4152645.1 efflux RND transporter permease subunit [Pseudomonadota bacterium]